MNNIFRGPNIQIEHAVSLLLHDLLNCGMSMRAAEIWFRTEYAKSAIMYAGGNQCEAARQLGIHRNTIRRILLGEKS
jgi:ActR/RegA family two-component response regulator